MTAVYAVQGQDGAVTYYPTADEAVAHMPYGATVTREDTKDTQ